MPVSLTTDHHPDLYLAKQLMTPWHCRIFEVLVRLMGSSSLGRIMEEGCSDSGLLGWHPQMARESGEEHLGWGSRARLCTFLAHSYLFWENLTGPGKVD